MGSYSSKTKYTTDHSSSDESGGEAIAGEGGVTSPPASSPSCSSLKAARLHYAGVIISFVLILPHEHFCGASQAKKFKSLLSIVEKSYINQICSYNFVDQKPKNKIFKFPVVCSENGFEIFCVP